ncbi:MAG: tyrosine--tRNA ligase [Niastella sp. SCN 39-18]|nr:tyrosine--tRNA ligase [Sphingobacteriales bacterium]ODT50709.1 MAG: tyrosine--tRNA ligase [Niastella sp. SCN 39-18]OJW07483.1 MAG: tyrosine--tRNA ligase [Sphingobacteriales bacterium 39-19]
MNKLIEELRWRGMLQDIIPGTAEQLNKEMTAAYIGFDPTADSLHIGGLVQILLLVHLQKAGHKPLALVGGATGMVGDPSGKSAERNLLSEDVLQKNVLGIQKQLEKFLNFDPSLANAAEIVNNFDWFKNMGFLEFIRDTGKHITVNYMMSKDSVKKRLEADNGISFTEFTYQLIQGYDFYWLYNNKNCKLQMGGSDQWGNIVTGTELIRRKSAGEAFAFTSPLITKADGSKFGKSETGNIWLDPIKTSPYQFYQFWLNASDADAQNWIKIFTFLDRETIETLVRQHAENPSERILQKKLAETLTLFVHGEAEFKKAWETTAKLFSNPNAAIENLSEEDLKAIEGIERKEYDKQLLEKGIEVTQLMADTTIFSSKGEARKMIQNGGLSINRKKVNNATDTINSSWLLHNRYLLVQKGKRNYYLIEITG